jgi:hypothetical protein
MIEVRVHECEGMITEDTNTIELPEFTSVSLAYWLRSNPGSRWESAFAMRRLLQVTPTLFIFDIRDQYHDITHYYFEIIGGLPLDEEA